MPQAWWFHAVAIVVPEGAARAMIDGAERANDISAASDSRSATLWFWSAPRDLQGARRVGALSLLWSTPRPGEATIHELTWDVAHGSEREIWRRVETILATAAAR